ncbi:hypothetical protein RCL1_003929 [Eukaryota sp. TZLM3-RCL]
MSSLLKSKLKVVQKSRNLASSEIPKLSVNFLSEASFTHLRSCNALCYSSLGLLCMADLSTSRLYCYHSETLLLDRIIPGLKNIFFLQDLESKSLFGLLCGKKLIMSSFTAKSFSDFSFFIEHDLINYPQISLPSNTHQLLCWNQSNSLVDLIWFNPAQKSYNNTSLHVSDTVIQISSCGGMVALLSSCYISLFSSFDSKIIQTNRLVCYNPKETFLIVSKTSSVFLVSNNNVIAYSSSLSILWQKKLPFTVSNCLVLKPSPLFVVFCSSFGLLLCSLSDTLINCHSVLSRFDYSRVVSFSCGKYIVVSAHRKDSDKLDSFKLSL